MKIGDKVRFLSEVVGGRVSGFQGKDIVLVEDEDGFEIPTSVRDVVAAFCWASILADIILPMA